MELAGWTRNSAPNARTIDTWTNASDGNPVTDKGIRIETMCQCMGNIVSVVPLDRVDHGVRYTVQSTVCGRSVANR